HRAGQPPAGARKVQIRRADAPAKTANRRRGPDESIAERIYRRRRRRTRTSHRRNRLGQNLPADTRPPAPAPSNQRQRRDGDSRPNDRLPTPPPVARRPPNSSETTTDARSIAPGVSLHVPGVTGNGPPASHTSPSGKNVRRNRRAQKHALRRTNGRKCRRPRRLEMSKYLETRTSLCHPERSEGPMHLAVATELTIDN